MAPYQDMGEGASARRSRGGRLLDSEFVQFVLAGGTSALLNFLSRIGFSQFVSYRLAVILAYLIGMITAFLLIKYFVFEKSGRSAVSEFKGFVIVNIVSAAQVWLISVGLAEYFFPSIGFGFYPEEVAHFIGLGTLAVTSYFGHKHFSFRKTP